MFNFEQLGTRFWQTEKGQRAFPGVFSNCYRNFQSVGETLINKFHSSKLEGNSVMIERIPVSRY